MTEKKKVSEMNPEEIKEAVRDTYSRVAEGIGDDTAADCCDEPAPTSSSCCGPRKSDADDKISL
ncbi:MAG: hypothetical protein ACXAAO_09050 [Candidatus Thorarchaeota archaeon]|jgi:hypothetical protein